MTLWSFVLLFVGLLCGPYAILRLMGVADPRACGRWSIAIFFGLAGGLHFWASRSMVRLVPPWVPFPISVIYLTGILEWMGAAGMLWARTRLPAGIGLILFLIAVTPANIYGALHHIPLAGHEMGMRYLWIRLPLQLWLISWLWYYVVQPGASVSILEAPMIRPSGHPR